MNAREEVLSRVRAAIGPEARAALPALRDDLHMRGQVAQDARGLVDGIPHDLAGRPYLADQRRALARKEDHAVGIVVRLRALYKDIAAPFGRFSMDTLAASTRGIASGSATDDSAYLSTENSIDALTSQRDDLEARARTALTNATFGGPLASEQDLKAMIAQAQDIQRVHPQVMWAKLEALAEGARIASKELWGR